VLATDPATAAITCDVIVVGAGPAGTAAAIELQRGGRHVVVVDKAVFPRDKCCGDGLTTLALRELEHLGLDPATVAGWRDVSSAWLRSPSGREVELPLPTDGKFAAEGASDARWKGGDPRETPSGYQHDVEQKIQVQQHPVTNGVADFEIHDEIYWGYRVGKDVTPLLTTSHPKSSNPIAWARTEQQSRVVYLQLGHGPSAFAHPSYRRLVGNAIRFAARR